MPKLPKAAQLLALLTEDELSELKDKLRKTNRHRLLLLIELFEQKNENFLNKELLFEHLFDEIYSPDQDVRVRNELRLLVGQIKWLLVEVEVQNNLKKNETTFHFHLLHALQNRRAFELFQKEYSISYEQTLKQQDYLGAYNLEKLNFVNITQIFNLNEKDALYAEAFNKMRLLHLNYYYLIAFRQHQMDRQLLQRQLHPYSTRVWHLHEKVTTDFENYKTDYSDYLLLKAKNFVTSNEERIGVLEQCLHKAKLYFEANKELFHEEIRFCLASLADAHGCLSKFETANEYYESYFELDFLDDDIQRLSVMGDYIANKINLNQISDALELLDRNVEYINNVPRLIKRWKCLGLACYAFLDDADGLQGILTEKIIDAEIHTKYYYRFYHAIYAFLEKRIEDAYREMENLRHLTSSDEHHTNIHPIVNFFHRFYYAARDNAEGGKTDTNNLDNLADDIRDFAITSTPDLHSYLPFLWLKRKLNS